MNNHKEEKFKVQTEQFADIKILRYKVPGFEQLDIKTKKLLYFLYKAALSGRDIIYDQNYKHNLLIRRSLENIIRTYAGDRSCEFWGKFLVYVKKVWFSNGIHHHYSMDKFVPDISKDYFVALLRDSDQSWFPQAIDNSKSLEEQLIPLIFDCTLGAKRVVQDDGVDMIAASANNFYEDLTQKDAEDFYKEMTNASDSEPISYGLNAKLVKENGQVHEKVWKLGGMYHEAIEKIVFWLEKAVAVAQTEAQKLSLQKLVDFYKSGDLRTFDEYCILWLKDTNSAVDVVNGFIEVYGDALGRKATFESVVSLLDVEATQRAGKVSGNAQWFEDHSPTQPEYKKKNVQGVSARGINVVIESGDCSPSTPIGINLPNADWIRATHGSKSVTINNIMVAYDEASKESGALQEFAWSDEEVKRARKYGIIGTNLHVDLHEIVGHGSGKLKEGVGNPGDTLKNYASTLEEARADLFALYFGIDEKLIELGLMPSLEVGYAEYSSYIRGGLMTQLVRVEAGSNLEESHMRNRQLIVKWVFEKGAPENVIERKTKDGKTYFVINDYEKLRELFGELLREVQRIKSEGDYEAGRDLVENYGVLVDRQIHDEVLERWKKLNIAPFAGFLNPRLVPVFDKSDEIVDVKIEYPDDFMDQMLEYAEKYSFLPTYS